MFSHISSLINWHDWAGRLHLKILWPYWLKWKMNEKNIPQSEIWRLNVLLLLLCCSLNQPVVLIHWGLNKLEKNHVDAIFKYIFLEKMFAYFNSNFSGRYSQISLCLYVTNCRDFVWYRVVSSHCLKKTLQWGHMTVMASWIAVNTVFLFNRFFRHITKKTSKFRVTGLCEGNPSGGFRWIPITKGQWRGKIWYHNFIKIWWYQIGRSAYWWPSNYKINGFQNL